MVKREGRPTFEREGLVSRAVAHGGSGGAATRISSAGADRCC